MEVKTIAVIGAGTMGRGIAYASALGGYRTILEDISHLKIQQAVAWIQRAFDEGVSRGKVEAAIRGVALKQLTTANKVEDAIREADLIIEAVPEEMEMKMELFTIFDKFAKANAIFASNTSSLSITEMSDVTVYHERCIGMHFFNPVPKMKLIELVKTPLTSDETIATCREVGRRMGKEVVVVKDSPGFITSRVSALLSNEAFALLETGIASAEDIDKALKLGLNHPMGPLELADLVGLDVCLNVLEYLHQTLGEKYTPSPLLQQYVREGRLGRKSGSGVYDYPRQESSVEI
ncbi:MAG TPA: 3-hydroxyacyl-CoA dehydrogenase NAD-binding domain-containing protein [Candidatus Acidoferrum sp.]|nr:3-hydroxyacyl-CoA dehydrogenase NAD-binding domain-containing protein [Candidatus Acidoferrum sp.]